MASTSNLVTAWARSRSNTTYCPATPSTTNALPASADSSPTIQNAMAIAAVGVAVFFGGYTAWQKRRYLKHLNVYGGTNMDEDIEGQVLVADIERRDKT